MCLVNLVGRQRRRRDIDVVVHPVHGRWPRVVSIVVDVFRVRCVEAQAQRKRLSAIVRLQEMDRPVRCNLAYVAGRPVGLNSEVRISVERFEDVEHCPDGARLDLHAELADKPGAVARLTEQCRVTEVGVASFERRRAKREAVAALGQAGQNGRTARSADCGRDERVGEPRSLGCERVDGWCFQHGMSGCTKLIGPLII